MSNVGSRATGTGVTIVVALVAVLLTTACEPPPHFEGGELREEGVPLYRRYVATFEPVPFDKPGEYAFPFRGFPTPSAGIVLETPSRPDVGTIEVLTTRIELGIRDQTGAVLCSGFGSPASAEPHRVVVWSNSGAAAGLWHSGCADVDLSHCDPCTLQVKLGDIDTRAPALAVVPALHGP